ncbi:hypothetical protein QE152_g31859 [Popillia japonica]|uniref:Uncharacterized protein n=1 Tax=Popillia japonica TaxID=7064 RepID=A0AAW1J1A9_POPJA
MAKRFPVFVSLCEIISEIIPTEYAPNDYQQAETRCSFANDFITDKFFGESTADAQTTLTKERKAGTKNEIYAAVRRDGESTADAQTTLTKERKAGTKNEIYAAVRRDTGKRTAEEICT